MKFSVIGMSKTPSKQGTYDVCVHLGLRTPFADNKKPGAEVMVPVAYLKVYQVRHEDWDAMRVALDFLAPGPFSNLGGERLKPVLDCLHVYGTVVCYNGVKWERVRNAP